MKNKLPVLAGAVVLCAGLLLACPSSANEPKPSQPPIPPMPMAGMQAPVHHAPMHRAAATAMDPSCVAHYDMEILKCGNKKKCKAKQEKLKKKCPKIYEPTMPNAVLPFYPVPGQPGVMAPAMPPMMGTGQMPHMGMMPGQGKVLEGVASQPTGHATGIKTLPENVVKPFWEN